MAILITTGGLVTTGTDGLMTFAFRWTYRKRNRHQRPRRQRHHHHKRRCVRVASGASYGGFQLMQLAARTASTWLFQVAPNRHQTPLSLVAPVVTPSPFPVPAANAGTIAQLGGGDGGDLITIGTGSFSAIGGGAGLDTIELVSGASILTGSTLELVQAMTESLASIALLTGAALLAAVLTPSPLVVLTAQVPPSTVTPPPMAVASMSSTSKLKVLTPPSRAKVVTSSVSAASVPGVIAGNYGKDVIASPALLPMSSPSKVVQVVTQSPWSPVVPRESAASTQAAVTTPSPRTPPRATSPESSTTLAGVDSITFSGATVSGDFGDLEISNLGDSKVERSIPSTCSGHVNGDTGTFNFVAGTALALGTCCCHVRHVGGVAATIANQTGFTTAVGTSGSVASGLMSFSGQGATVAR